MQNPISKADFDRLTEARVRLNDARRVIDIGERAGLDMARARSEVDAAQAEVERLIRSFGVNGAYAPEL